MAWSASDSPETHDLVPITVPGEDGWRVLTRRCWYPPASAVRSAAAAKLDVRPSDAHKRLLFKLPVVGTRRQLPSDADDERIRPHHQVAVVEEPVDVAAKE